MKRPARYACFVLLLALGLNACGGMSRQARRAASERAAMQLASATTASSVDAAVGAVLALHLETLHTRITPALEAEHALAEHFRSCKAGVGAVIDASDEALAACEAPIDALDARLEAARALATELASPSYHDALDALLGTMRRFTRARQQNYRSPKSHADYASMIDTFNAWSAASKTLRAQLRNVAR